jgi:hypothetical protein
VRDNSSISEGWACHSGEPRGARGVVKLAGIAQGDFYAVGLAGECM